MRMQMSWCRVVAVMLGLTLVGAGCGDDGGDDSPQAGTGGGSSGSGGSAGEAGSSGGGSGTGGTGGAGTGGGGTGGTGLPTVECDTSIPTTATCGGTECPAPSGPLAMFTCGVPCCAAGDQCGTRSAIMGMTTECAAPAVADPSCPAYEGMAMGMDINLEGCCTADNVCGVISSISMLCITQSMFLPDLQPGPACGDGDADAGTP